MIDSLTEKGLKNPSFLQVENWHVLDFDDMKEIDNHFEWVVHRAKSRNKHSIEKKSTINL
ncbi:hypothetical protein WH51_05195 [Bacilli bacterium VT-13-104]|nr:hypothetical protein WH51_05195 [Bacilli bacterium VT-13-104]